MLKHSKINGLTLIELLIIIMIVVILAAIVTPNFVTRHSRAPVSLVKADLRTFATAIESYHVDNESFPDPTIENSLPILLTTPIAYLSYIDFVDPYSSGNESPNYRYYLLNADHYLFQGRGPDGDLEFADPMLLNVDFEGEELLKFIYSKFEYDSSNGTASSGDIFRSRYMH